MSKTAVLLINLGTPDSPKTNDVRRYLSQFLNDPRVIDIQPILRFLLVNLIIVPFRAPKSAKIYKELWTDKGSPLLFHGESLQQKLAEKLGNDYEVFFAMRYQNPSLQSVLEDIKKKNFSRILIFPLFPHYASSSSGSAMELALQIISKWYVIPEITILSQYWDNEGYINAFVAKGKEHAIEDYEHVLFSYHGLPTRQVDKVYDSGLCTERDCEHEITHENKFCYKATCYATTRLIAEKLAIPESKYSVGFQSRLDSKWIEPFSDKIVEQKAKEGIKSLLVFSPAFVADCLETTIEIGEEYKEIFQKNGGKKLTLVESLNDHPIWVDAIASMVKARDIK
jgi:ferrochelatase